MSVPCFSHSDDRGLAFAAETHTNQVQLAVSSVHLGAENALEPFAAQRLERLAAWLTFESR